jgi:hypothetical protein
MATKRAGRIGAVQYEDGSVEVNQDELLQVMQDIAGTLRVVGGMFSVAADRVQVDESGEAKTVGYLWKWDAFTPSRREPAPRNMTAEYDGDEPMPHEDDEPVQAPEPVEA